MQNEKVICNKFSFAYDSNTFGIHDIDLTIQEGEFIVLTGKSGCGKTTLTRCINGLIPDFFEGTITGSCRVCGMDIGKPGATKEEVYAAAKAAQCHEFIEKLPKGYDTLIGEGGVYLSGGEEQRVAVARAILKNAPIEELVKDRTVVMIAHKLKTIAGADQIIVLDQGEVKEVGTHKELMNNHGLYRHLWDIQQTTAGWQIN